MSTRILLKECLTENLSIIVNNINNEDFYDSFSETILELNKDSVKELTRDFKIDETYFKIVTKLDLIQIINNYMVIISELKKIQNEKINEIFDNNFNNLENIKVLLGDIHYENNKKIHEFGQSDIAKKRQYNSFHLDTERNYLLMSSSYYEYDIFNLVNILNNFDFDKKVLFIYI